MAEKDKRERREGGIWDNAGLRRVHSGRYTSTRCWRADKKLLKVRERDRDSSRSELVKKLLVPSPGESLYDVKECSCRAELGIQRYGDVGGSVDDRVGGGSAVLMVGQKTVVLEEFSQSVGAVRCSFQASAEVTTENKGEEDDGGRWQVVSGAPS